MTYPSPELIVRLPRVQSAASYQAAIAQRIDGKNRENGTPTCMICPLGARMVFCLYSRLRWLR